MAAAHIRKLLDERKIAYRVIAPPRADAQHSSRPSTPASRGAIWRSTATSTPSRSATARAGTRDPWGAELVDGKIYGPRLVRHEVRHQRPSIFHLLYLNEIKAELHGKLTPVRGCRTRETFGPVRLRRYLSEHQSRGVRRLLPQRRAVEPVDPALRREGAPCGWPSRSRPGARNGAYTHASKERDPGSPRR